MGKLEDLGSQGEKIFQLSDHVAQLTQTSQETHLQLLSDLLECIYGKRDLVVTSQDLATRGFDTSKEPQTADYWEYI